MYTLKPHEIQRMKELYPPGTRVELLQMGNDPNPVPPRSKGNMKQPMSPEMKMELRRFDSIARQSKFLCKYRFEDLWSIRAFTNVQNMQLRELESKRRQVYNKLRKNPSADLISARDALTNDIKVIRHELRCANEVIRDSDEKLRILRRELHMKYDHQRDGEVKHRSYER